MGHWYYNIELKEKQGRCGSRVATLPGSRRGRREKKGLLLLQLGSIFLLPPGGAVGKTGARHYFSTAWEEVVEAH